MDLGSKRGYRWSFAAVTWHPSETPKLVGAEDELRHLVETVVETLRYSTKRKEGLLGDVAQHKGIAPIYQIIIATDLLLSHLLSLYNSFHTVLTSVLSSVPSGS